MYKKLCLIIFVILLGATSPVSAQCDGYWNPGTISVNNQFNSNCKILLDNVQAGFVANVTPSVTVEYMWVKRVIGSIDFETLPYSTNTPTLEIIPEPNMEYSRCMKPVDCNTQGWAETAWVVPAPICPTITVSTTNLPTICLNSEYSPVTINITGFCGTTLMDLSSTTNSEPIPAGYEMVEISNGVYEFRKNPLSSSIPAVGIYNMYFHITDGTGYCDKYVTINVQVTNCVCSPPSNLNFTITQPTCNLGTPSNNGSILLNSASNVDK